MNTFASGPLPAFIAGRARHAADHLKQPDFGNTVMVVMLLFAMLFAAGARAKHLAPRAAARWRCSLCKL